MKLIYFLIKYFTSISLIRMSIKVLFLQWLDFPFTSCFE